MCFGFNRATYFSFSLELSSSSSQLFIFHSFLFYGDGDAYERHTYSTQCLHLKFGPHRFKAILYLSILRLFLFIQINLVEELTVDY